MYRGQEVPAFQFSNDNDPVANNKFLGNPFEEINVAKVITDDNKNKGHSIFDFVDKLRNLPTGSYKVLNGQIIYD